MSRWILFAVCTFMLAALPGQSGEKKNSFEVFAKGYAVKNNAPLKDNPAYLVVQDKKTFDKYFGVGFVMGLKPRLVDAKVLQKNLVVAVIKSGNAVWNYQVEDVHVDKDRLVVKYKATGKDSVARFKSPLIVAVPRGDYAEVYFIENGKEVGKAAVAKK